VEIKDLSGFGATHDRGVSGCFRNARITKVMDPIQHVPLERKQK
jgi:hypothetical protein